MRIVLVLAALAAPFLSGCIIDRGVCVGTTAIATGPYELTVTILAKEPGWNQDRCLYDVTPKTVRLAWTQDETYPEDLNWFVNDTQAADHVDGARRWRFDGELPVCQNVHILAFVRVSSDGAEHEGRTDVFLPC